MKTEAEAREAMRWLAARIVMYQDCPCDNCFKSAAASSAILGALAWVYDLPLDLRHLLIKKPFADQLASLKDMEDVAKLTHDPRMAEILPPAG